MTCRSFVFLSSSLFFFSAGLELLRPFVRTETETGIFSLADKSSASGVIMVNSSEGIRLVGSILLNMVELPKSVSSQFTRFRHVEDYNAPKMAIP